MLRSRCSNSAIAPLRCRANEKAACFLFESATGILAITENRPPFACDVLMEEQNTEPVTKRVGQTQK